MIRLKKSLYVFLAVSFMAFSFFTEGGSRAEAATGTWKHSSGGWWYSYADGSYARSEWLKIRSRWYYFNASGYMATGWKNLDGKWYYLSKSGAMAKGWQKISDKWYYFNSDGAMVTGWKIAGGRDYYFSADGVMVTDWNRIDDKEYYFDPDGAMVIGGVVVGEDTKMPETGAKVFMYSHDPKDSFSAMNDVVEDPDAVFGYSPDPESSRLKDYVDVIDWTDPVQVAEARKERQDYFNSMSELYIMIAEMQEEDKTSEEIARAVSRRRNELRLEAYEDDPEGLAKIKKNNLETYGHEDGPDADEVYRKYGSWQVVLEKALSTNVGMDLCLGFYDEFYFTYGFTDSGAGK